MLSLENKIWIGSFIFIILTNEVIKAAFKEDTSKHINFEENSCGVDTKEIWEA